MVEPIFKAPLPPTETDAHLTSMPDAQPQVAEESPKNVDLKQKILPYLWYVFGGTFFVGLLFGLMMSGDSEVQVPAENMNCSLPIIKNPDIRTRMPLCGTTDRTKGCVLYLMNTFTYDKLAKDFFNDAADKTERSRYTIEIENPVYSNTSIYPGHFAQIKIPAMQL